MGGTSKNSARAVIHQDKVRDPDWQFPVGVKRVFDAQAGIIAQLFRLFDGFGGGSAFAGLFDKGCNLGVFFCHRFGNGVTGRNTNKGRAVQGVGAGGIDLNRVAPINTLKPKLQAARFADPVFLHQLHLGWPVVQITDGFQQLIRHG